MAFQIDDRGQGVDLEEVQARGAQNRSLGLATRTGAAFTTPISPFQKTVEYSFDQKYFKIIKYWLLLFFPQSTESKFFSFLIFRQYFARTSFFQSLTPNFRNPGRRIVINCRISPTIFTNGHHTCSGGYGRGSGLNSGQHKFSQPMPTSCR